MVTLVDGLRVELRKVESYGSFRLYPVNHVAKVLCEFVGQKTLTERDLRVLGKIAAIHVSYVKEQ